MRYKVTDKYWADLKALNNKHDADRGLLDDKYNADREARIAAFRADVKLLDDKYGADLKVLIDSVIEGSKL